MKKQLNIKKLILLNLPYILMGLFSTNFGEAWRMAVGADASAKMLSFFSTLPVALASWWPSLHPLDLLVGLCCGAGLRLAVYLKSKNAKKYRHGMEYGSARWGTHEDIAPYVDPVFQNNVILTKTESLTMNSRPKDPKTARNKNVLVIGGSGSGKTRFWLKPNLMQMHSSYVVTDPKGTILVECGKMLQRGTPKMRPKLGKDHQPVKDRHGNPVYETVKDKNGKVVYEPYRIKVLNTINFKKSMHYNPFAYLHSEKDILKLVTTLIANTKGEGKAGDDFWVKAETLLYCALIGYIHYEAPVEEQNFATLIEFINAMEVREDDEEFKNPVDLMFDALEAEKPNHFAVRQYKKYKLAAGVIETYGMERVSMVLSNTVQLQDWDGRYSRRNKEWAKTIPNDNPETVRCGYALNSHPAVLDGFIDLVREEQQRSRTQREKLEPSRPSVRDKLKQELPAHKSAAPKKREPER